MEVIFFVYGLAFFLLGFTILYYPKKNSSFKLAGKINFVGWFGILHGVNEWLDLLILINALELSYVWQMVRALTLPISFLALVYFGSQAISTQKKNCSLCKLFTPALAVLWGILFLAGDHSQHHWDILSRYVLGFPGAALTGVGLFTYMPETKSRHRFGPTLNLKAAGIGFIAYAILAGLVVSDDDFFPASLLNYSLFSQTIGVPVQMFRSLCAIVIAYNLIRLLEVFNLEMQQSLVNSQMRFRTVVNKVPVVLFIEDKNHMITFLEGQGLASLGIDPSSAVGKPASQVFAEFPAIYQGSGRSFSIGEEFTEVIAGPTAFYDIFFAPLKDQTGAIDGAIGVVVDVSEPKKAQKELEKYRIEMEKNKALAAIGSLSSEIAGEMMGPLDECKIALLTALGGLRKTIGATEVKSDIREGIDKISQAIKILDAFCKKANLRTSAYAEPIDLFETVQRVLSVFKESAHHAMVRITTEGAEMFPTLHISSRELEQVLYIMLQNIIQAVDGTHVHNLNVAFSVHDNTFCMVFSENSVCDSHEHTEKALSAKSPIAAGADENNFNFSVLKGIVETYKGTIALEPDAHHGTLVKICLPLAR